MKLKFDKNKLTATAAHSLQRAGYKYVADRNSGQESFIKVLGNTGYPRFHLYIEESGDKMILNLHLDQKRPRYKGQPAHSGEYEGSVVEEEAERLKKSFQ